MHITRAFPGGNNESAENEIHIIHTADRNIEYCTGCFACMRRRKLHSRLTTDCVSFIINATQSNYCSRAFQSFGRIVSKCKVSLAARSKKWTSDRNH